MRGKHYNRNCGSRAYGITPAHAGKTAMPKKHVTFGEDHPRACGENGMHKSRVRTAAGSPPRMRGKPTKKMCPAPCIRITPAHAGKTAMPKKHVTFGEDHPRACGENGMHKSRVRTAAGSPPRMRGKPTKKMCPAPCIRITPAHAGKTA